MIEGFPIFSLILFLMIPISFLTAFVFLGIWTYKDAKERGLSAGLWTFLVVVFSKDFLGILLYLLIGRRDSKISCPTCAEKTPLKAKFCKECGAPIDSGKVPPFVSGKKWIIAMIIALAIGLSSVCGFMLSAASNVAPFSSFKNVNIGAMTYGVGNSWKYTAMYSNDTQQRTFVVNSEEDDMLFISGSQAKGLMTVIVSYDGVTVFVGSYPPTDESTEFEIPIDAPVGTSVNITVVLENANDVKFEAELS